MAEARTLINKASLAPTDRHKASMVPRKASMVLHKASTVSRCSTSKDRRPREATTRMTEGVAAVVEEACSPVCARVWPAAAAWTACSKRASVEWDERMEDAQGDCRIPSRSRSDNFNVLAWESLKIKTPFNDRHEEAAGGAM